MVKCTTCGKYMRLRAADRYEVRIGKGKTNLLSAMLEVGEEPIAECFDCPRCGCQNIMQFREVEKVETEPRKKNDMERDGLTRENIEVMISVAYNSGWKDGRDGDDLPTVEELHKMISDMYDTAMEGKRNNGGDADTVC